jgi:mannose-6-phosphate isomerase-like protein (cupin superfamily)
MIQANEGTALSVRRTSEIEATSDLAGRVDRYLIESADSGGLVDLLEQILPPRALAAPVHRHSREDEYSVVLEGRLGVFQDDEEVFAAPGDIVFKPRGHWHTFWNAGDGQLRILEVIAPGGIEELFRRLAGGSTTRQRCRRWPPNTAVMSTSSAPCHWSSGTASSFSLGRVRRCRVSRGAGGNARGRLPAQ